MYDEQCKKLKKLVTIIQDNMKGFYIIGCSLMEILDNRLYREISDRFEDFCRDHLCISQAYAYRQIAAAKVVKNLSPNGDIPKAVKNFSPNGDIPINESQARPLSRLKPEEQRLAWRHANDIADAAERKVTARDVSRAVSLVAGKEGSADKRSDVKNIDVTSREFKKAYEAFFEAVMKARQSDWETTSKRVVLDHLKSLIKFINSQS